MQFDPGLEYKPNRGEAANATAFGSNPPVQTANPTNATSATSAVTKDDPS